MDQHSTPAWHLSQSSQGCLTKTACEYLAPTCTTSNVQWLCVQSVTYNRSQKTLFCNKSNIRWYMQYICIYIFIFLHARITPLIRLASHCMQLNCYLDYRVSQKNCSSRLGSLCQNGITKSKSDTWVSKFRYFLRCVQVLN